MAKPFDISKFRKELTKSIDGLSIGFNDPTDWISTGNYALNYLISGDFFKGVPLGKVTVFAGESGAGKSFLAYSCARHAQKSGYSIIYIDTEQAIDLEDLPKFGIDNSLEKFRLITSNKVEDVNILLTQLIDELKKIRELFNKDTPLLTKEELIPLKD